MSEIKIGRMVLGICQTNCYFLYRTDAPEAVVVDPADYGDKIAAALEKNGFRVAGILITHGHFDHILGCDALKALANEAAKAEGKDEVKVYACEAEKELMKSSRTNLSASMKTPCSLEADVYVKEGGEITLAGMTFKVIETPGHTQGGCCYYLEEAGILISGDTLFQESVGRTDFPTGSMSTLVRSIKEKLFVLPEDTLVYPGHGDSTTIAYEKKYNPFCG